MEPESTKLWSQTLAWSSGFPFSFIKCSSFSLSWPCLFPLTVGVHVGLKVGT